MSQDMLALTSGGVEKAIARNPIAVIPFGSTEQHGPHLPCGTDVFAAELIGRAVADRLDALFVPFGPYGVTPIHQGTPGTVSLSPATFEGLVRELCTELIGMGVKALVLVNWHEMNTPSLDRVATDIQDEHDAFVVVAQACYTAARVYEPDGGELTHGGSIETLAVLAHDPSLARLELVQATYRTERAVKLDEMRRSRETYGFVTDIAEFGGGGWYGDPHWATKQRAEDFAARIADEIARQVNAVLEVRSMGHSPTRQGEEHG